MKIKDIGLPLTYIGGFMVGFSLPAYSHFRGDHIMFPVGLLIVAIGTYIHFKK